MKLTQRLHDPGQSLWLDNRTRDLLSSGTLKHYIDELSVTGLTSDLTIFDQAIKNSSFRHLAKTTCGLVAVAMSGTRSTRRGMPSVPPPMGVAGRSHPTTVIRIG
jgi:hypothetical protein